MFLRLYIAITSPLNLASNSTVPRIIDYDIFLQSTNIYVDRARIFGPCKLNTIVKEDDPVKLSKIVLCYKRVKNF